MFQRFVWEISEEESNQNSEINRRLLLLNFGRFVSTVRLQNQQTSLLLSLTGLNIKEVSELLGEIFMKCF